LFYANFPSVTDSGAAPVGMDQLSFLVPLAPGINDTSLTKSTSKIMNRFEVKQRKRQKKYYI
jgi:phytoene desaturase